MRRHVSIAVLTAVLLTACPRSNPVTPKTGTTKGKSGVTAVKSTDTSPSPPGPAVTGPDLLAPPPGDSTELAGTIAVDAAYAVAKGAAKIISDNGGGLIANNGSSLVANNGSNLVGHDPADITSHLGAALTGKVKLIANNGGSIISDHGSGIISDNGGGIIANNGGGLVSNHGAGFGLLEAEAIPAHKALPVGGMLVGVQSLKDGAFLPLGVDRTGQPVYAVYTDAKGGFKVHLPASQAQNVLVVASVAKTDDTRLAVDLLARPVKAAGLQVDDASTVITSYLRSTMIARVAEVVDPNPCLPAAQLTFSGNGIALGVGLYEDLLAGATFKALPRAARQRVLVRFTDALLSLTDLENAQIAPALEPGSKVTGAALPVLKDFLATFEKAAAERLTANPNAFDEAFYVKVANLDRHGRPPVQIGKPSDLSEFIVNDFLATNDKRTAERAQAILVDLGLPTQMYLDLTVSGASLIAAIGATLTNETNKEQVREAIKAAIKEETGAPPSADPICQPLALPSNQPGTQTTFAGDGHSGSGDGPAATAQLDGPARMVVDPGGFLIVSDGGGHRLRKIDLKDAGHTVSTIAGSKAGDVDGPVASATFNNPSGLALDGKGNLYVSEKDGNRIRKVADYLTDHAVVSTIAGTGTAGFLDGAGASAQFSQPMDLTVGPDGALYVADSGNNRIRRIDLTDPSFPVTTLAGNVHAATQDGLGAEAGFHSPRTILWAPGGYFLIADTHDGVLRRMSLAGGVMSLVGHDAMAATDGTYWTAGLEQPVGLALAADGTIYVVESKTGAVRVVDPKGFVRTLVAPGTVSGGGAVLGPDGTLYVADPKNDVIRAIKP